MKKLYDDPLCFVVSLKEVIKSGGNLNLKDSLNALANMQVKKRIQKIKREYKRKEG